MIYKTKLLIFSTLVVSSLVLSAQNTNISGEIINSANKKPIEFPNIILKSKGKATTGDQAGKFSFQNMPYGKYTISVSALGFEKKTIFVDFQGQYISILLRETENTSEEVVITGTMKEVNKLNSAIPVEVYSPNFFKKNPTPSIFEALTMVNGVQPQLNCNVCGTGDIHINGMEGPYTMVLIDGMPIVSSLSTVYGLTGIPNSMVKRVEVIKGPAGSLYGSEAVAGVINIITKDPEKADKINVDIMGTSYLEFNTDISAKAKLGKSTILTGLNVFNFNERFDINKDNFTDIPLVNRISLFNKWSFERKNNRSASIAARLVFEDRFGGEMNWKPKFKGTDSIYGESITTKRLEVIGNYQLPIDKEKITFQYSFNLHNQNSYYGNVPYFANQQVGFAQLLWDKKLGLRNDIIVGLPFRYIFYDDNTLGTQTLKNDSSINKPQQTFLPGIFIQDEIKATDKLTFLAGLRFDYNSIHGPIYSPRASIKYSPTKNSTFRLSAGNGFRVVNLFTEDHAALTGSRRVVIKNDLKPEESWNANLNYTGFINQKWGYIGLDASVFYTYFTNKIVGDFLTNPSEIIYDNLKGHAISKGISSNIDFSFTSGLKIIAGVTLMDVYQMQENIEGNLTKIPQLHAPKFSGTYQISYSLPFWDLSFDYSGRVYGPMDLPVVTNDFRPSQSPWFDIANIQITKKLPNNFEIYGGVKNLWNFQPKHPLLRPEDPFDKKVQFDNNGNPTATTSNPGAYTFDASYNYAALQSIRAFLGVRWKI